MADQLDGLDRLIPDLIEVAQSDEWWWSTVFTAITHLADGGQPFSVEDVRQLGVTEPDHANRWGAAFITAARAGIIAPVAYEQSTRRSRHGAPVRIWIGMQAKVVDAA